MTLRIRSRAAHGALQRILTVVGRRGSDPLAVASERRGELLHVEIELPSEGRDPELLARMLGRLYDVLEVRLEGGGPG